MDYWFGWMGGLVKIWFDKVINFLFKYNFNIFDGSVLFLDGKKEGDLIGV